MCNTFPVDVQERIPSAPRRLTLTVIHGLQRAAAPQASSGRSSSTNSAACSGRAAMA